MTRTTRSSSHRQKSVREPQDPERLRILRISTDTYPEVVGGGAIHAHNMSATQASYGHDVTVLTSNHGDDSLPRFEHREGYTVRRFSEWGRPFGNSITPGLFRELHRHQDDFDIVHAHSHLYLSTNMAAVLSNFHETPLVLTNHGLFSQSAPAWFNESYLRTLGRFTFNAADRVLCYTATDEQRLREFGVSTPVSLVNNGVDCEKFSPTEESSNPPEILFVGRLVETKGVEELLEAFARINIEARLRFVGGGPLRDQLEKDVYQLGVSDQVSFTGQIPNDELPGVYAQSSVFALPSSREGLPRTVLEALACGTPVVTSDLPQLKPLIDGVGMTVPQDDISALAKALEQVLSDSELRARFGSTGRKRVVEDYSWKETVRQTTAVYRELLM